MKACPHCSTTYDDRVDFCFRDGTPLEVSAAPVVAEAPHSVADLPEPRALLVPTGAPSIADMLDAPEPGFAVEPRKIAPVTREPRPVESFPEEELPGPELLESLAPGPLVEPLVEPAAEPDAGPSADPIDEELPPPVALTEDTGIDVAALPPLSDSADPLSDLVDDTPEAPASPSPEPTDAEEDVVAVLPPPLSDVPVDEPAVAEAVVSEVTFAEQPAFADEPEEESKKGGIGLLLGVGALLLVAVGIGLSMMDNDPEPVASVPNPPPVEEPVVEPPTPPPVEPVVVGVEEPIEEPPEPIDVVEDPPIEVVIEPSQPPVVEPPPVVVEPPPEVVSEPDPVEEPASPGSEPVEENAGTAELDPGNGSMWGDNEEIKQGSLSISTNPSSAVVWLDTKRLGSAPISSTVDFGRYTIKVELDGYRTEIRSVDVQSASLSVPFELKSILAEGTVHIYGKIGHLIYIDQTPVGTSPVNTTLTPGRHTIRVVAEDGSSATITRDVQFTDATTPFIIDLSSQ